LFLLGVVVAGLTTFYMFRLAFVVFYGQAKSHAVDHAHESPGLMAWPLRILAVLSVIGAFMGIEKLFEAQFEPEKAGHVMNLGEQLLAPINESPLAALFGLFAVVIGFSLAFALYSGRATDPLPEKLGWLSKLMRNRFYFDELYEKLLIPCTQGVASWIADKIDQWIIFGAVRFTHGTTEFAGRALRLMQSGSLQHYALALVLGVAIVLWFVLGR
jgi:NADH-quinone oxidoreductase subunit L